MTAAKILFIIILLAVWTILFWGICVFLEWIFRILMRKRTRRSLESRNKVVAWDSIKNNPSDGVIWLNRSKKYFHGLQLWWIPLNLNDRDADLFVKWQKHGLLIDSQELDVAMILASGHRIEDYDER